MLFNNIANMWLMIVLLIINRTSAVPYNQPNFCPNASWYPNATTLVNSSIIGTLPFGIFVNINNTVYANSQSTGQIEIWTNGGVNHARTISSGLAGSLAVFVTDKDDIYVDNGDNGRVDMWTINGNNSVPAMNVSGRCTGLFVDINNTLYCSIWDHHLVIAKSMDNITGPSKIVAGNGSAGAALNMLNQPHGIFVDINFNLYVADCTNNRIQRFEWGQLYATTVAVNGASENISLNCPTGIVFDANGYLFIVDRGSNRIFGSNSNGFRCLVGCSGGGSASNELNNSQTLSFDSYGNMFVTDRDNNRIQKFDIATNFCDDTTTSQPPTTSTMNMEESTTAIQSTYLSTIVLIKTPSAQFVPPTCSDPTRIGINCNISNAPCDILKPCQNYGSCINTNNSYICICPFGFNGTECQFDYRPCKPNTCWNNGTCKEVTNTTFNCTCAFGWTGIHCETKINYCENVTCLNNGVCRPLLGDYKCECLGDSFSGRHCEITANRIVVRQFISKSFSYIAILAGISVIAFIVIMDILKYCFGIDPTRDELERIRRKKRAKKAKRPVIIRYTYVNAPPPPQAEPASEEQTSTIKPTTV